jgi:hypothetical protein
MPAGATPCGRAVILEFTLDLHRTVLGAPDAHFGTIEPEIRDTRCRKFNTMGRLTNLVR